MQSLGSDPDEGRRGIAAVMLRRLFERSGEGAAAWGRLPLEAQASVKDGLMGALANEANSNVLRKLCHAIAEIALVAAGPGGSSWPELLPRVFGLAQSPNPRTRETAIVLFGKLAEYAGNTLLVPHAATLHGLLPPLLSDADNAVRIAALSAIIALLSCIEDDGVRAPFQGLLPNMMKVRETSSNGVRVIVCLIEFDLLRIIG